MLTAWKKRKRKDITLEDSLVGQERARVGAERPVWRLLRSIRKGMHVYMCIQSLSHVWLFATSWTVAHKLLCQWDSPGKNIGSGSLPDPGIEPTSPALAGWYCTTEPPRMPYCTIIFCLFSCFSYTPFFNLSNSWWRFNQFIWWPYWWLFKNMIHLS